MIQNIYLTKPSKNIKSKFTIKYSLKCFCFILMQIILLFTDKISTYQHTGTRLHARTHTQTIIYLEGRKHPEKIQLHEVNFGQTHYDWKITKKNSILSKI